MAFLSVVAPVDSRGGPRGRLYMLAEPAGAQFTEQALVIQNAGLAFSQQGAQLTLPLFALALALADSGNHFPNAERPRTHDDDSQNGCRPGNSDRRSQRGSCSARRCRSGRVEVEFQPDPGPGQVQKTQETMGVFVVAGGHAPPLLEPAEALFHGIARLVSFRVVGLGIRAPFRASMPCCSSQARKASPS